MAWPLVARAIGAVARWGFGRRAALPRHSGRESRAASLTNTVLDVGWRLQSLGEFIDARIPHSQNVVVCRVIGQPQSNLNNIYQFAVAAAWGALPPVVAVSSTTFKGVIDHKNKIVEVSIGFLMSGLNAVTIIGDYRKLMYRPIPPALPTGGTFPPFLYGAGSSIPGIVGGNNISVTDYPDVNPGLAFSNGTRGFNNTLAVAAPLQSSTCAKVPVPSNTPGNTAGQPVTTPAFVGGTSVPVSKVPGTGNDLTQQQLDLMKSLFFGM